jgi:hypothetical protein
MSVTKYSPEEWLETAVRGIKDYAEQFLNSGYEIVMEFPTAEFDSRTTPWDKTIIHFAVDAIDDFALGFGREPTVWNYSEAEQGVFPQWGAMHLLNFDVGVWACDASGGLTSRLRAKQYLHEAFGLPHGVTLLREATNNDDGQLEILSFSGGRNIIDTVNDFRVYRMVDCNLEIRVFSRTRMPDEAGPAIMEIPQEPVFFINDNGEVVELDPQ